MSATTYSPSTVIPPWRAGHTAPSSRPGFVRHPIVPTAPKRRGWFR